MTMNNTQLNINFINEIINKTNHFYTNTNKIELIFYLLGSFQFIVSFFHFLLILPIFKAYVFGLCHHRQTNNRTERKPPHRRLFKSLNLPIIDSSINNTVSMFYFIQKYINVHTWLILCMAFVYGGLMVNFLTLMSQYLRSRVTSDFVYQVELIYKLFILSFLIPRCVRLCCCNETNDRSTNSLSSSGSGSGTSKKAFVWMIRQNFKIYLMAFK